MSVAGTPDITVLYTYGMHVLPLPAGEKSPRRKDWQLEPSIDADRAVAHVERGGGLGVIPGKSNLIVLDCDDAKSRRALAEAGYPISIETAGSQNPAADHHGGGHVWLAVPPGTPYLHARHEYTLPNGGKLEVIASDRSLAVAPPTAIGGYRYRAVDAIRVAPAWLYDETVPGPPGLEPIHGVLDPSNAVVTAAKPTLEGEAAERQDELNRSVDSISWSDALDSNFALMDTDSNGCGIWHYLGGSTPKSLTCHEAGCPDTHGSRVAVIFSASVSTAYPALEQFRSGRDYPTVNALQLAAAVQHGGDLRAAAAAFGITLGGGHAGLIGLDQFAPGPVRITGAEYLIDPDRRPTPAAVRPSTGAAGNGARVDLTGIPVAGTPVAEPEWMARARAAHAVANGPVTGSAPQPIPSGGNVGEGTVVPDHGLPSVAPGAPHPNGSTVPTGPGLAPVLPMIRPVTAGPGPFPVDALPAALRAYCIALAESVAVPVELVAPMQLAVLAAGCGPANIYVTDGWERSLDHCGSWWSRRRPPGSRQSSKRCVRRLTRRCRPSTRNSAMRGAKR
ncbi:bifunctional DNA primase/polymerase [Tsukamurella soli]|uniref:bifunctional DNA primase/polymerase n=1 Tax=Tsukamurella soli TaxID=644556 RepID=UPI003618D5E7